MIWLALYCPTLTLDCLARRWPRGLVPAMAVSDLDGSRRFIAAATSSAQESGVFVGQSVATALAMRPDLLVMPRHVDQERNALVDAALAVLRFTPNVSIRAAGLVLELSGSLRLFGGRSLLFRRIAATMRVQGLGVTFGEGPTPQGAWLLAKADAWRRFEEARSITRLQTPVAPAARRPSRTVPSAGSAAIAFADALDAVPVPMLESLEPPYRRLTSLGIRRVADLRRLPAAGLARRFGPALPDELDRALGERPDPQHFFAAPVRFDLRIELLARVETAEALVFAAQRLIAQLCGWLAARRGAVRAFALVLHHERWSRDAIEPTRVPIALATPSNEPKRIGTVVRERLSLWELKAPVLELSLEAPAITEEREAVGTLFPDREEATDPLARLLEKLIARLGADATTRIERVADHRPERAWRAVQVGLLDTDAASPRAARRKTPRPMARDGSRSAVLDASCSESLGASSGESFDASAGSPCGGSLAAFPAALLERGRAAFDAESPSRSHAPSPAERPDEPAAVASSATIPIASPAVGQRRAPARATERPVTPQSVAPGPRPAWLLPEPRQLDVRADRPLYEALPLALLAGPERIEAGWWDDATATRDYFIAGNAAGQLVWIYRERLVRAHRPMWFLQGLFA